MQDGYSDEDVIAAATIAAQLCHDGYTIREIEIYIRKVRLAGEL